MSNSILTPEDVRSAAPSVFSTQRKSGLSDRYKAYCTWDCLQPVFSDGWQPIQAGQSYSQDPENRFFKRHLLRLSHPDLAKLSNEFQIQALITNSYDGTTAFKVELGVWRWICANGCVDAEEFDAVSIRHVYAQEKVQGACQKIVERAPAIAGHIEDWRSLQLDVDQIDSFRKYATVLRFGDHDFNRPNLDYTRRDADHGNSLWSVFNRIQESCLRGGQRYLTKAGRNQTTREIRSIDRNLSINRKLWAAAETLFTGSDLVLPS